MSRFSVGEQVRVEALYSSECHGLRGTIVEVLPDASCDTTEAACEYAVQFRDQRRWFRAVHLARIERDPSARFLRAELLDRYKQLRPSEVAGLDCRRDEVIAFLKDRYSFTTERAEREADDLFFKLRRR